MKISHRLFLVKMKESVGQFDRPTGHSLSLNRPVIILKHIIISSFRIGPNCGIALAQGICEKYSIKGCRSRAVLI